MRKKLTSIGIDVGGTKISMAALQNNQIISDVEVVKTPDTASELLEAVLNMLGKFIEAYDVDVVGIATAGAVDITNSKVLGSTGNLPVGYKNIDFKSIIEEKFKIKTLIENDANAAAYASFKTGNVLGHNNSIVITLGTGIGGGIIVEGKLLKGKSGGAAEIGHLALTYEKKRKCTCGAWDCWESYASGTGYVVNARELASSLSEEEKKQYLKDKNPEYLTTYDIRDVKRK